MGRLARNHDELTLDQLSDREREEVFSSSAPTRRCSCSASLRCRLPTMLDGDDHRLRLVYSLLLLPGTPVLFYGEEIGWVRTSRWTAA